MNQSTSTFKRWFAMLSLVVCIGLSSYAETIDGIVYTTSTSGSNRTATVTGYSGSPRNVVIPAQIQVGNTTYTVTTIGDAAFAKCTSLESITIPASVTKVGTDVSQNANRVFYGCINLKSVKFEDGGTSEISLGFYESSSGGKGLFADSPLREVYIGRNITYPYSGNPSYRGYSAFYNQQKLATATISNTVTVLPDYLFYKCGNLQSVQIGKGLVNIPKACFAECGITLIDIPESIKTIGDNAFAGNKNMTTVKLPTSLRNISNYAFYDCRSLKFIEFHEGLQTIGASSFYKTAIATINIPATVTSIGENAFQGCSAKQVIIGNGTTEVGAYAFQDANLLEECIIGDKVNAILRLFF